MKYRKKPEEAFRLGYDDEPKWWKVALYVRKAWKTLNPFYIDDGDYPPEAVGAEIETLGGIHKANHGDYIIQGVEGEIYPCKPDIFEKTYEAAE